MKINSYLNSSTGRGCTIYMLRDDFILETWERKPSNKWDIVGEQYIELMQGGE